MRRIGGIGIGPGGPRKRGSITSFARHFRRDSHLFPDNSTTSDFELDSWVGRLHRRVWIALGLVCIFGFFPFSILYGSNIQAGRVVFWLTTAVFLLLFQLPRFRARPKSADSSGAFKSFCTLCDSTTEQLWDAESENLHLQCTVCNTKLIWEHPYVASARCPRCQCKLDWQENYNWTLRGSCTRCRMSVDSLPPVMP